MTTKQLAKKYFEAVDVLNSQIKERELKCDRMRGQRKASRVLAELEHEISILRDMRDEALSNAYYLDNYYRKDDEDAGES